MALRFEEFSALRRRQQSVQAAKEQQPAEVEEEDEEEEEEEEEDRPSPPPDRAPRRAAPGTATPAFDSRGAGNFFETPEVQAITLALIFLDVTCSVASGLLTCGGAEPTGLVGTALHLVEIFSGFTVFFFLLELLFLIAAFRQRFFTHLGNLADLAVVLVCLVWELDGRSRGIRLLGVLRFWRLVRLVNSLVMFKDVKLQQATEAWQADQQLLEETRLQVARLEESLRRELDSKRRVEAMCRSYKDEVETLNEALKIAALDIAQTAGEQFESDDEKPDDVAAPAPRTIFVSEDGTFTVKGSTAGQGDGGAAEVLSL